MTTTPTWYEALEFAARHQSSDWPEHCQQIVKMARAALAQKDHERLLPVGEVVCINEPTNEEESGPVAVVQLYGNVQLGDRLYAAPQQAEAVPDVARDAERYRQVRRGQKWSVIDGIGDDLKGEELDAAIDAAMTKGAAT